MDESDMSILEYSFNLSEMATLLNFLNCTARLRNRPRMFSSKDLCYGVI